MEQKIILETDIFLYFFFPIKNLHDKNSSMMMSIGQLYWLELADIQIISGIRPNTLELQQGWKLDLREVFF